MGKTNTFFWYKRTLDGPGAFDTGAATGTARGVAATIGAATLEV
jgi:hypothetical protein